MGGVGGQGEAHPGPGSHIYNRTLFPGKEGLTGPVGPIWLHSRVVMGRICALLMGTVRNMCLVLSQFNMCLIPLFTGWKFRYILPEVVHKRMFKWVLLFTCNHSIWILNQIVSVRTELNYRTPGWCPKKIGELLGVRKILTHLVARSILSRVEYRKKIFFSFHLISALSVDIY